MKNIIKNSQKRFGRIILVIINILLILAAVLSSLVYSDHIRNERMGTAYGDQIIHGVAECIRASLRTGEQVYRIM